MRGIRLFCPEKEARVQTQKKQWVKPQVRPLRLEEARNLIERARGLIEDDRELKAECAELRAILAEIDENLRNPH